MIHWLMVLAGCAKLMGDDACRAGELGCPCTHGDGCDPLLTCSSRRCEDLGWNPDGLSLPIFYGDLAFDPDENRLLATYDSSDFWEGANVVALDLDDESGRTLSAFPTDFVPEHLAYVAGLGTVVSLSPSRWSSDDAGFGYVARVESARIGDPVVVPADPGDVDVTPDGVACVLPRSSRDDPPACVDLSSGDTFDGDASGSASALAFHPSGRRFYSVDGHDLDRWDLTEHGVEHTYLTGSSPFDERECYAHAVRVHPDGHSIWTDCAMVFYSSNDELADGQWANTFGDELDDLEFQPGGAHLFAVPADGTSRVLVYDGSSQALTWEIEVASRPRRVFAGPDRLVVVRDSANKLIVLVDVIPYPPEW